MVLRNMIKLNLGFMYELRLSVHTKVKFTWIVSVWILKPDFTEIHTVYKWNVQIIHKKLFDGQLI
jgi:hypothetical protein